MAEIPWIVAFAVTRIITAFVRNKRNRGSVGAKKPRITGEENIAHSQRRMSTDE